MRGCQEAQTEQQLTPKDGDDYQSATKQNYHILLVKFCDSKLYYNTKACHSFRQYFSILSYIFFPPPILQNLPWCSSRSRWSLSARRRASWRPAGSSRRTWRPWGSATQRRRWRSRRRSAARSRRWSRERSKSSSFRAWDLMSYLWKI